MKRSALLKQHRDAILALARKRKVANVRVFGSAARGDDSPRSDIDLLVDPQPDCSLFDLIGFAQDVEELLGVHVDVVSERGLHPLMRDRVFAEAVPV